MASLYYSCHSSPGFLWQLINQISDPKEIQDIFPKLLPIDGSILPSQLNDESFCLILPGWKFIGTEHEQELISKSLSAVSSLVDSGKCTLLIDFSNEAASIGFVERVSQLLCACGIADTSTVILISQNRLLSESTLSCALTHMCADAFVVSAWLECKRLLLQTPLEEWLDYKSNYQHDLLCLNATPRWHRLYVLLKLIEVGLVKPTSAELCNNSHYIPFISFPGLSYGKGGTLDQNEFCSILSGINQSHLLAYLDELLKVCPLKVDDFNATGNQLASMIDIRPYLSTKISVVTETALDSSTHRITEKTMKALALGHPFVTIGHPRSLEFVAAFGYAQWDDLIDNDYDSELHWPTKVEKALQSVKQYLKYVKIGGEAEAQVNQVRLKNIYWTLNGFQDMYFRQIVVPLLRVIRRAF